MNAAARAWSGPSTSWILGRAIAFWRSATAMGAEAASRRNAEHGVWRRAQTLRAAGLDVPGVVVEDAAEAPSVCVIAAAAG